MVELKVIDGIKKDKPNYRALYSRAFINTGQSEVERMERENDEDMDLDTRKKLILYGVKQINATSFEGCDYEWLVSNFNFISSLNNMMSELTPRELQTIFPISKEYDGGKYGFKDYFYTKKRIEEFGMDRIIGEEMARFHWDYCNWELTSFASQTLCVMSAIRRAEGDKGIVEEFMEEQGVTTHTLTKDDKGNEFLTNNDTGDVQKVCKPRPMHLKVLK